MTDRDTDRPGFVPNALEASPSTVSKIFQTTRRNIQARILSGLLLVTPILITIAVVYWLYSLLEQHVIGPIARLVMWKVQGVHSGESLPDWFATYAAPCIALLLVLLLLYCLGFFVRTRLRNAVDWLFLRVPVVSGIYDGVRKVLHTLDQQRGQTRPQRVVLIAFPHPGMRVPAFVTGSCRDTLTQKVILCVYVPTTPVPTSGYFLLVPEEEATELDWGPEQALQTIISAGLTAPPEIRYFKPDAVSPIQSK